MSEPLQIVADTPIGPTEVTVRFRDPADVKAFGGPPVFYIVRPDAYPPEFTIDGASYGPVGGEFRVSLDGRDIGGGGLYRISVGVVSAHPSAVAARDAAKAATTIALQAVADMMRPHHEQIANYIKSQRLAQLDASIARHEAKLAGLRAQVAEFEQSLRETTTQRAEVSSATAADIAAELWPASATTSAA